MTELAFLVDNNPAVNHPDLASEHGFSLFIRFNGKSILCDTGASRLFIDNAVRMGIDLKELSFAFLSHGHSDHTGGLEFLLEQSDTDIFISPYAADRHFISLRHENPKDISTDPQLILSNRQRFKLIGKSRWLDKDIAAVYNSSKKFSRPYGNSYLKADTGKGPVQDDFSHEMSLVLKREDGLIIISPCSHCGAVNIINSCREFTKESRITAYIGGLHFVDSPYTETEAENFLKEIKKEAPDTLFYTGHCTGKIAKEQLAGKGNIKFFHTGMRLVL